MYATACNGFNMSNASPTPKLKYRNNSLASDLYNSSSGIVVSTNSPKERGRPESPLIIGSQKVTRNGAAKSPQLDWRESSRVVSQLTNARIDTKLRSKIIH